MLEVLPKIAKMQASYALGKPLALPMNLTISVSYRCNSRCKTCNVWQRPNDDFTLEEYDKTFASIGRDAYWFTFSGGEPTLRKDLPEMVESAYRHCRPGIINIPTNGIQDKIIPERIERGLQAGMRKGEFATGVSRITQAFRDRYYDLVKRTLVEQRQVIPCLAGIASAQIAPNGDVWTCCIRAESVGNLREHDYDFRATWSTAKAAELRRSIKAGECYCPLANDSYTNMLCHTPTLTSVGLHVAQGTVMAALPSSKPCKTAKIHELAQIQSAGERL